jgi:hypothetical protein
MLALTPLTNGKSREVMWETPIPSRRESPFLGAWLGGSMRVHFFRNPSHEKQRRAWKTKGQLSASFLQLLRTNPIILSCQCLPAKGHHMHLTRGPIFAMPLALLILSCIYSCAQGDADRPVAGDAFRCLAGLERSTPARKGLVRQLTMRNSPPRAKRCT